MGKEIDDCRSVIVVVFASCGSSSERFYGDRERLEEKAPRFDMDYHKAVGFEYLLCWLWLWLWLWMRL